MFVRVDGRPTPVVVTPAGAATFSVVPPAKYDGRENVMVDATLGEVVASQPLHVTGGPPVRLTLQMAAGRIVADGKRGTQLRVQAVDRNGTPTSVSGLSWETPQGRIREVRVPRDGEYLAEYVPERTREPHRETIAVMASETLRADASFEVTPPPVRVIAGARTGLFTNFGETVGPMAFVEGLAPLPVRRVHLAAGFAAGYLRGDVTSGGVNDTGTARLETNQFPLLAVARVGVPLPRALEIAAEARPRLVLGLGARHRESRRERRWSTTAIVERPGDRRRGRADLPAQARLAGDRRPLPPDRPRTHLGWR